MSKLNRCIIECSKIGYKVLKNGEVKGLTKILKLTVNSNGYNYFSFRDFDKKREIVLVHRLQAYQKFGESIFEEGMVVRHLDGNSLNNSWNNIAIGTNSDNQMDRSRGCRLNSSILAIRTKQDSIRSIEERNLIYEDLKNNIPYSQIMLKYNVSSKGTLSFMKNKSIEYQEYLENN